MKGTIRTVVKHIPRLMLELTAYPVLNPDILVCLVRWHEAVCFL